MIKKPNNYDNVEINDFDFEVIELGGHKGIIMQAEEYTSPQSGKTSLKVSVDTAKDDKQPNFFAEQYKNDTRIDRRWSNNAIKYIPLGDEENQIRMLKSFITAYENSNNCKFAGDKDWNQLKNKKIGLVFGMEEYENQNGETRTTNRLRDFRSLDKIENVKIPKVKKIDGTYVELEEYSRTKSDAQKMQEMFGSIPTVDDKDLPF